MTLTVDAVRDHLPAAFPAAGPDLLVALDIDGTLIDHEERMTTAVRQTVGRLRDAGARVVVAAHLGRPKGAPEERYSLRPVADRLSELLGREVAFATDTVGESARSTVDSLADGDVALLENVRFSAGETSKDDAERGEFAGELAQLALQWVLRDPRVTSAVIGASSVEQLDTNLDALTGPPLTDDELAEIDRHAVESGVNLWAKQTAE